MAYMPGEPDPWEKHKTSRAETRWGDGETMVSREDLIEAEGMVYDEGRAEWAWPVVGSFGFPRCCLGTFVIRLTDEGELVTSIE